jgi:hypothetical protein
MNKYSYIGFTMLKKGVRRPEYEVWRHMVRRCTQENNPAYPHYGGRGITVCDAWVNSFENFLNDMGCRPSKKHTLERNDNDKGYSPTNCRWATYREQINNRRTTVRVEFNGVVKPLSDWALEFNIDVELLRVRLKSGWDIEDALKREVVPFKKIPQEKLEEIRSLYKNGYTITEVAKLMNVPYSSVCRYTKDVDPTLVKVHRTETNFGR